MAEHLFPQSMRIEKIKTLLELRNKIIEDDGKKCFNLEKVAYISSFTTCFLVSLIQELTKETRESIKIKSPKSSLIKKKFLRMGLFEGYIKEPPSFGGASALPYFIFPFETSLSEQEKLRKNITSLIRKEIEIPHEASFLFNFSLKEIIDNAFTHGKSKWGCIVCAYALPEQNIVRVCFLDRGQGIYNSLKQKFPKIKNSEQAILESLKKKVSRINDPDRGVGLYILKHSIEKNAGDLTIISYDGLYDYRGAVQTKTMEKTSTIKNSFPGTIIELVVSTSEDYKFHDDDIEEVF